MNKKSRDIYIIDGHAFCYRAYYAIRELSTSKGMPTNAIYGFINILRKIIKDYDPGMVVVTFDTPAPTARHKKYKEYKIHRKPMPDDLIDQIPRIKEVISAFNIPICQMDGYEADDIIATLARKAEDKGFSVTIVTSDKDALQLVTDNIRVLSSSSYGDKIYDANGVKDKYGVGPELMVDLMALMGDASDNVPGVKGIGKIFASKLVSQYGTLDNVYKHINDISSKSVKEKLLQEKDMAELSKELVQLDTAVPVELDVNHAQLKDPDTERLAELYKEFEFGKLLSEVAPAETGEVTYSVIKDKKSREKLFKDIKKKKIVSLNICTDPDTEKISGIAFSLKKENADFVSFDDQNSGAKDVLADIKDLVEDETITKIGYDLKTVMHVLAKVGIDLKGTIFDVMIADYLIDPVRTKNDLPSIAMRHLNYNFLQVEDVLKWDESGQGTMDLLGQGTHAADGNKRYMCICEESDVTLRLYSVLEPELRKKHLDSLFLDVEVPLIKVLQDMEKKGVGIDVGYLKERSSVMADRLEKISGKIYKLAGEEFNINSPKQLQVILYEKLKLPVTKKTKTGFSTDESVLNKLAGVHELPKVLLEYRELNKLKTGYYDSILELVDRDTQILHAKFNQAVTATGRLSSSEPNLQNVPIRTTLGKEIRRAFVPGEKGKYLLAADYSQVELRILAHLSKDEELINAFKAEEDVHKLTAAQIFGCDVENVTKEMRSMAKTVNFGIVYGISAFGLAKDLDIPVSEAQEFIDSYFKRYSGVKKFIDKTIAAAKKTGFVTTLLNRRRYVPELNSNNEHVKGFAERVAVNTPVQGSAADLIKLAMIRCYETFKDTDVDMLIQVHDELVFKVPKKEIKSTAAKVKEIMEGVVSLEVPLKVDIEAGENWLDMKEIN